MLYFGTDEFQLMKGNCIELMKQLPSSSIQMIFADPPYFLSSGGITCKSGRMVSVNKADWDVSIDIASIHDFNVQWLQECKRLLHKNGTIWVSGTYHNIYSVGFALQSLGYKVINNITWYKKNAPPNLSCRSFTHSSETIIWAKASSEAKHIFNYKELRDSNEGKQVRDLWTIDNLSPQKENDSDDIWTITSSTKKEKHEGSFPTQKPLALLERIIRSCTEEGQLILDPFNGSGTTGIAAVSLKRRYIGIDIEREYLDLTIRRYNSLVTQLF